MVILAICVSINGMATASRQAWAFARDNGLPFSRWFDKVTIINSTPLPVRTMFVSLGVCFFAALLNLGGSEVFDSIFGLGSGAIGLTYILSLGSVLWRRLFGSEPLPKARWSLGYYGPFINAYAVLYEIMIVVISFFPLFAKVNARTMNWGIAMFGGVALICAVYYGVHGRKAYRGPVVYIKRN